MIIKSVNIIRVIKSRGVKWAEYLARMGEVKCLQDLVVRGEAKRPLARAIPWRLILNCTLEWSESVWAGFVWLRIGHVAGFLNMGIGFFIYIYWEFLSREELSAYQEVLCSMERLRRYKNQATGYFRTWFFFKYGEQTGME